MKAKQIALALLLGVILGCGGAQKPKPGPLPEGASFYGVWQSPQYGNMHLCQSGKQVIGDYVKHERAGRIQGDVDGDLLVFQWEDRRELVSGKPQIRRGRAYFRIEIGEDGDTYVKGEWGMDEDLSGGGPWNAVKLRRGEPDRCTGADEPISLEDKEHPWDVEDDASGGASD
ncbi:MAG: hypothetical protein JRF54_15530 [Deltaproteobacteria bacterium]|nr:hypothetical protein [Deltaproteobacteria bacterium]MBW2720138.1 hypothetical protein [Deltaproteobacteria bacterium]